MEGTPKDTVSRYKIMNGRKSKQKLLVQEAVLSINVIELVIHQIISFMRFNVWIETNIDRHIGINVCCVLYNLGLCFSWIDFKGKNTAIPEKDDEIISAASMRIHGTRMAEMPFVATQQKFGIKGLLQKW
ncbi:PREDICTED: increased DNA methylation 1 [Prunus dulcis]|nr:PREDICTED: increased DNA methylation 1 [Prunus dulcis]